ncbi:MAG: tRNA pseudouridine(55) synthase TruB [FCB group bacterium]|nr:tRNA pseudouridine(55) synthase TruB [FCB group bacterium]
MDAIVPAWKPVDWTSFDVVKKMKSYVKPSKVGHAGTLDPFAEGILILCIGKKTSEVESLMELRKTYVATIRLGITTDTLDPTGEFSNEQPVPELSRALIEQKLSDFIGEIDQTPPMYSALKKNGVPLYKLARKGLTVPRRARKVRVYAIELLNFTKSELEIRVECGRGTYIRVLGSDIAAALGTIGYLIKLTRTRIGNYTADNAVRVQDFSKWLFTAA